MSAVKIVSVVLVVHLFGCQGACWVRDKDTTLVTRLKALHSL